MGYFRLFTVPLGLVSERECDLGLPSVFFILPFTDFVKNNDVIGTSKYGQAGKATAAAGYHITDTDVPTKCSGSDAV